MIAPIRQRLDYQSVVRKTFLITQITSYYYICY